MPSSTCLQDYNEVQYNVTTKRLVPEVTKHNTYYKFFIIELYVAFKKLQDKTDHQYTMNIINKLYALQDCLHAFLNKNGAGYECRYAFKAFVEKWPIKDNVNILNDQKELFLVNPKGDLEWKGISRLDSFKDIIKRLSESLDNFIKYCINDQDMALLKKKMKGINDVDALKSIGEPPYSRICWLLPDDHINAFLIKFNTDK